MGRNLGSFARSFPCFSRHVNFEGFLLKMDLLGSILGNMAKPPGSTLSDKERERKKKEKELAAKLEKKQREEASKFREEMEKEIQEFANSSDEIRCKKFCTMSKYYRSLLHDITEVAGLVGHSFGIEDEDRHMVVWKKQFPPSEDELSARRGGVTDYDPQEAKRLKQIKLKEEEEIQRKEVIQRKKEKKI